MSIAHKLREEFFSEMDELSKIAVGTEEYRIAVEGVTKIADRLLESDKQKTEHEEHIRNQDIDKELRLKQLEDERKDRKYKNAIVVADSAGKIVVTVIGVVTLLTFEEKGTITSRLGSGIINWVTSRK